MELRCVVYFTFRCSLSLSDVVVAPISIYVRVCAYFIIVDAIVTVIFAAVQIEFMILRSNIAVSSTAIT